MEGLNKRAVVRIFEQGWNRRNFDGFEELIADDATFYFRGKSVPMNADDLENVVDRWHRGFPDFSFSIESMAAENDMVAVRLILSGTHKSDWKGMAATGKFVEVTAMMFLRFEDGKLVDIWEDFDEYGLRMQLSGSKI